MACVWTSTWEGLTVIWGWEWYQPTTLRVPPVSLANLSTSVKAVDSCSGEISTHPFLLSERCKTMTEWMWTILTVSNFLATVWISVLVYVNLGSLLKSSFNSMHSPITSSFSVLSECGWDIVGKHLDSRWTICTKCNRYLGSTLLTSASSQLQPGQPAAQTLGSVGAGPGVPNI